MGEAGAGCLVTSGLLSSTHIRLPGRHRNSRMLELEEKTRMLTRSPPLNKEGCVERLCIYIVQGKLGTFPLFMHSYSTGKQTLYFKGIEGQNMGVNVWWFFCSCCCWLFFFSFWGDSSTVCLHSGNATYKAAQSRSWQLNCDSLRPESLCRMCQGSRCEKWASPDPTVQIPQAIVKQENVHMTGQSQRYCQCSIQWMLADLLCKCHHPRLLRSPVNGTDRTEQL